MSSSRSYCALSWWKSSSLLHRDSWNKIFLKVVPIFLDVIVSPVPACPCRDHQPEDNRPDKDLTTNYAHKKLSWTFTPKIVNQKIIGTQKMFPKTWLSHLPSFAILLMMIQNIKKKHWRARWIKTNCTKRVFVRRSFLNKLHTWLWNIQPAARFGQNQDFPCWVTSWAVCLSTKLWNLSIPRPGTRGHKWCFEMFTNVEQPTLDFQ